ncbi:hypothetical protein V9T40_014868 [Parthenolecanium corni]|uniref:G domain-containing protein n=1 Tax=Parthenolecanium corni TaxID=536013 RepID=A0AAN9TLQ0_9HEMI
MRYYQTEGTTLSESDICHTYNIAKQQQQQEGIRTDAVLSLLCDGESKIIYRPGVDIVAIIGRTGTGKTKLVEIDGQGVELKGNVNMVQRKKNASGTISDTLLPVWFFNNKTNTLFLDCPGFEDTRGAHFDISDAHFTQLVLNKSHRVKFILVESYRNLIKGGERNALPTLLRHVTTMIKAGIGKFSASIGLIASMTQSSQSDDDIIRDIAKFLSEAQNNPQRSVDEVRLINILLQQQQTAGKTQYTRIGFARFRRNLDPAQNFTANPMLDDLIYSKLSFTKIQDGDFGYTISDNSLLGVHQVMDEITAAINSNVAALGRTIATEYSHLSQSDLNEKNLAKFTSAFSYLLDVKQQLEKFEDLYQFQEYTIPQMAAKLNVTFSPAIVSNIRKYENYMTFFSNVSHNTVRPRMWSRGFATDELKFLYESQRCQANPSRHA